MSGQNVVYEIDGYGVVLSQIQNVYPVEADKCGCPYWGFKYLSGVFEYFNYKHEPEAKRQRQMFVNALNEYWDKNYVRTK